MIDKNKINKLTRHFKSKKMATQLFQNYILFLIILIGIFMLTIGALLLYISINNKDAPTVNTTADYIIREDYKDINVSNVIKYNGFVEVLDTNLVVIMESGSKHEVGFKYPMQYFHDMVTNNLKDDYFYSSKYGDNEGFILITAMPNNIYDTYTWGLEHIELLREVSKAKQTRITFLKIFPFIIFIFSLSTMILYSKLTSRIFVKPLKKLLQGVNTLKNGEYSARVEINSLNEIGQLKDAVNLMAEKIQQEITLKEKSEQNRKRIILDISHDLKNPLTSILGYSELLLENDDILSEDRDKLLRVINNNSKRANDLIQDLFELSRVESMEYKLDIESYDIGEFLRELIAGYVPMMEQNGVKYEVDITEDEVELFFDRKNLDRALSNIILTGFDLRRMNMLLAVLEKRAGFKLMTKDVFLNIAGGLRVDDPAMDLAVIAAILSSNFDVAIDKQIAFAGEIGLTGEIRPVNRIEQRIAEAQKLGFKEIYLSKYNKGVDFSRFEIKIHQIERVEKMIKTLFS